MGGCSFDTHRRAARLSARRAAQYMPERRLSDLKEKAMSILETAMSPSRVVEILAERGITISERTLRESARKKGACRVIGKTLFLTANDIDILLNDAKPEPKPCHNSKSEAGSGITNSPLTDRDIENLRARLTKGSRKTSPSNTKTPSGVLPFTGRKRS
jgi:hypothetical protein